MQLLTNLRKRMASNLFLYRVAMAAGLAKRANLESQRAAEKGEKLLFKWNTVYWEKNGEVVMFPPALEFALVGYYRLRMATFRPRLIFKNVGSRQVADLRGPAKYRLPSGGTLWLPVPAEPIDFFTGYFAKGGPREGQVVLDGGAYCGETTLEMAARVGPKGHVYAFEPDPKNLVWLRRNVEESGLRNITVVPKGLWGKSDTLKFYADQTPGSTLVASDGTNGVHRKETQIEVLSPQDAFAVIGRVPDFVKMDIEGAEVEVVEAMAPLLTGRKVSLAIASYHFRDGRKTHELISGPLEAAGLNVETGHEEHLTTWAWRN